MILCDQGTIFASAKRDAILRSHNGKRQISGVEPQNTLVVGQRYHSFLCHVFGKEKADALNVPDVYALALAVKAASNTAGPQELVPTFFVFGILPHAFRSVLSLSQTIMSGWFLFVQQIRNWIDSSLGHDLERILLHEDLVSPTRTSKLLTKFSDIVRNQPQNR